MNTERFVARDSKSALEKGESEARRGCVDNLNR